MTIQIFTKSYNQIPILLQSFFFRRTYQSLHPVSLARVAGTIPRAYTANRGTARVGFVKSVSFNGYRTHHFKKFYPGSLIHHRTCNATLKKKNENYLTTPIINELELRTSSYCFIKLTLKYFFLLNDAQFQWHWGETGPFVLSGRQGQVPQGFRETV